MRMVPRRTRGLLLPHEANSYEPIRGGERSCPSEIPGPKKALDRRTRNLKQLAGLYRVEHLARQWQPLATQIPRWRCSVSADKLGCNQLQSFQTRSNSSNRVHLMCLSPSKRGASTRQCRGQGS
jgi:hypothetical protein